jgi:hypothetical protein
VDSSVWREERSPDPPPNQSFHVFENNSGFKSSRYLVTADLKSNYSFKKRKRNIFIKVDMEVVLKLS